MSFQAIPPERLFQVLNNTGLQNKDNPLFQLLFSMIAALQKLSVTTAASGGGGGGSSTTVINQFIQQILDSGSLDGADGFSIPGATGATGAAGAAGSNGRDGAPGFALDSGDSAQNDLIIPGPPGTNGTNGSNGTDGAAGPPGFSGEDGLSNDITIPGPKGEDGPIVPYHIGVNETFLVPLYKQALFAMNIDNEGTIEVDGFLIEVDPAATPTTDSNPTPPIFGLDVASEAFDDIKPPGSQDASTLVMGTLADGRLSSNVPLKNGTNAFTGSNSFATNPVDLLVGQLKFPASQNPSADANTLDDYEEGLWTPALTFGGAATGIAYDFQVGTYVKIGRFVALNGLLVLNSKGSSTGAALISGLPFTVGALAANFSGTKIPNTSFSTNTIGLQVVTATATMIPIYDSAGTNTQATDVQFTNTSGLIMYICYQV